MTSAALDRLLAVLVVGLAATGLVSLRAGEPGTAPLFAVHGLLGGALAAAVLMKLRRSLPRAAGRPPVRIALSLVVSLAAVAALAGGFLWVASGRILSLGGWTVLTLHAWVGLVLVPLVVVHLVPRRWRLLRPSKSGLGRTAPRLLSRRALMTGAAMTAVAVATSAATGTLDRLFGGERRFTGSRPLPAGGIPPVTTFFGEATPNIDPASWRLSVRGRIRRPADYGLDDLRRLPEEETSAILDCTSGWSLETTWSGSPLAAVLDAVEPDPGAGRVEIRAITGWSTSLTMAEARRAILATAVAGEPLPPGNGAPCRLVVPDRRGLDWVKWVTHIEVA
jgi:DMSO/TMAO reductase YedYZ molybdopterin-dependent catalytic subunit